MYGNAPITAAKLSLAHTVPDGGDTGPGDSDVFYALEITSTSTQFMVEMGGHLAVSRDGTSLSWGQGLGAGSISGGPYHFRLTQMNGESLGSQDNQIKSGDIITPARKEGTKFLDLNGDGVRGEGEQGLPGSGDQGLQRRRWGRPAQR